MALAAGRRGQRRGRAAACRHPPQARVVARREQDGVAGNPRHTSRRGRVAQGDRTPAFDANFLELVVGEEPEPPAIGREKRFGRTFSARDRRRFAAADRRQHQPDDALRIGRIDEPLAIGRQRHRRPPPKRQDRRGREANRHAARLGVRARRLRESRTPHDYCARACEHGERCQE